MPVTERQRKQFEKRASRYLALTERTTNREIQRQLKILKTAKKQVLMDLRTLDPTEWRAWYLPELTNRLDVLMGRVGADLTGGIQSAQEKMFEMAVDKADELAFAAGLDISPTMLSPQVLSASQTLTGELIRTVPATLRRKLGGLLSVDLMQEKSIGEVIADIQRQNVFELSYFEAERIVRTELLRTHSLAAHKRNEQMVELQPGLLKGWRSSHKPDARSGHLEAEAKYMANPIPFNEAFVVRSRAAGDPKGATTYKEMDFPHDSKGGADNVINCGCLELIIPPE